MRPSLAQAGDVTAIIVDSAWKQLAQPEDSQEAHRMNCLSLEYLRFGSHLISDRSNG